MVKLHFFILNQITYFLSLALSPLLPTQEHKKTPLTKWSSSSETWSFTHRPSKVELKDFRLWRDLLPYKVDLKRKLVSRKELCNHIPQSTVSGSVIHLNVNWCSGSQIHRLTSLLHKVVLKRVESVPQIKTQGIIFPIVTVWSQLVTMTTMICIPTWRSISPIRFHGWRLFCCRCGSPWPWRWEILFSVRCS